MYDPSTIYIPPGYGKITFGRIELKNIFMAVAALTFAFTMFFYLYPPVTGLNGMSGLLFAFGVSLTAVLTGFMLHEFAHKVLAQRNGAWAEFRAYPFGLMLAVVFSFLGFIFAAPGAVYIQVMINRKQNGIISIAGPLVNMALGITFLGLGVLLHSGLLAAALYLIGSINVFLAAFNMLPIPPFDGYKVFKWSVPIYIVSFGAAVVLAGAVWFNVLL
jgi:Zn-dependent protease